MITTETVLYLLQHLRQLVFEVTDSSTELSELGIERTNTITG